MQMALETCRLDSKDKLVQGVLQHVMGTTPRVKYNPYTSLIAKAAKGAAQSPFYVRLILPPDIDIATSRHTERQHHC